LWWEGRKCRQNLQPLLEELRLLSTGASFPKAEWYWTRTPDYRAKVVNDGEFRVFLRVALAKSWFRVSVKGIGKFQISNSADLEGLRETIQTAYKKAEKYLQPAN
jgi:hypothetical protein